MIVLNMRGPGMTSTAQAAHPDRTTLLGCEIDPLTLEQATQRVLSLAQDKCDRRCRYVVTPNVDHVVQLRDDADLQRAYDDAALVLADGAPLVAASRLLGRALPERVAGSDLVPSVFAAANSLSRPLRVFLLGQGQALPSERRRTSTGGGRTWKSLVRTARRSDSKSRLS